MSRPANHNKTAVAHAAEQARQALTADELRRALAVLLPAVLGATHQQLSQCLGIGQRTVARYRSAAAASPDAPPARSGPRGGRRNFHMTPEQEKAFLQPWIDQAGKGQVIVVSPIRAALAAHLGQPVRHSLVYRMLARHGWRKVAPDTRHPKSDPAVQSDWKKNSRKRWQPL